MSMETEQKQDIEVYPMTDRENERSGKRGRSFSVLAKIAFWAYLVGAFMCGIIALILTLAGSANKDILITTAFFVAGAVVLATRTRWAPVVSSLLGGYLFYVVSNQPYVIASLANPKTDPQGGFGHFIGVVFISACVLLALGASIGAAIQNYSSRSRKAPRWLPSGLSLIAGMMIGAILIGAISQQAAAPTGLTYTNGVPTVHLGPGSFLQSSVTITKGSKLLLVDDTPIEHDLFNGTWQNSAPMIMRESGAPVVNNVQLNGKSTTIGPFATAGTYHILCTIHRGMTLTIIVQ